MRFVIPLDASALASGAYEWGVDLVELHGEDPDQEIATRSFTGNYAHEDGLTSLVGAAWSIAGVNRLVFSDEGVGLLRGGAGNQFFESDGQGGYSVPAWMNAEFVDNQDGTYTMTYHGGGSETWSFSLRRQLFELPL